MVYYAFYQLVSSNHFLLSDTVCVALKLSMLGKTNLADDSLKYFFLFFFKKTGFDIS